MLCPKTLKMMSGAFAAAGLLSLSATSLAGEYVVKLKESHLDMSFSTAAQMLAQGFDALLLDEHEHGQLALLELRGQEPEDEARKLVRIINHPMVEYAVENIQLHAVGTPDDPRFSEQWALEMVNAERAWSNTTGSREIVVAVTDTGIDFNHEDLKDNMWVNPKETRNGKDDDGNGFVDDIHGWDFHVNNNNPMDKTSSRNPGHGTHCAGIIGAVGNNGKGVSGMTQRVSLMALRFLDENGSGNLMNGAKAIDYATNNGAHIISASWGAAVSASMVQPILEAIGRAEEKGIMFVVAAANDGKNNDTNSYFPTNATNSNVISVAASQSDDTKPSWSNYGVASVDIAAPGHQILNTFPGNKYGSISGTSMATPLVAGMVALILAAQDPNEVLTPAQIKALLLSNGAKVDIEVACNCRIDAAESLDAFINKKLTVVPAAATVAPGSELQFSTFGGTPPYTFRVGDSSFAGMTDQGLLKGVAEGETTVFVTDANGVESESLKIRIGASKSGDGGEECPLQDPVMCALMCLFDPSLPWCS